MSVFNTSEFVTGHVRVIAQGFHDLATQELVGDARYGGTGIHIHVIQAWRKRRFIQNVVALGDPDETSPAC